MRGRFQTAQALTFWPHREPPSRNAWLCTVVPLKIQSVSNGPPPDWRQSHAESGGPVISAAPRRTLVSLLIAEKNK
jgi:hypothetical protein